MTHCPRCGQKLARNEASWPGRVILGCRHCGQFAVETGERLIWINGGPGWLERLKATVKDFEEMREIMESDDDDPRWERMMV